MVSHIGDGEEIAISRPGDAGDAEGVAVMLMANVDGVREFLGVGGGEIKLDPGSIGEGVSGKLDCDLVEQVGIWLCAEANFEMMVPLGNWKRAVDEDLMFNP